MAVLPCPSPGRTALAPFLKNARRLVEAIDDNPERQLDEWLSRLPELQTGRLGRNDVGSAWGHACCLFASVPNQKRLVRKLTGTCDAVVRLLPARQRSQ